MKYEIKELGIGEMLDQGIQLFKDNIGILFKVYGLFYLPIYVIGTLIIVNARENIVKTKDAAGAMDVLIILLIFAFVTVFIVAPIVNAAVLKILGQRYLGEPAELGSAIKFAIKRFIPLVLTSILSGLIIFIGCLFLLIPGILLAFMFWLVTQVVVLENLSGSKALGRSRELMKDNWGKAFVLGLILGVVTWIIDSTTGMITEPYSKVIASGVFTCVIQIFTTAATVAFYFFLSL